MYTDSNDKIFTLASGVYNDVWKALNEIINKYIPTTQDKSTLRTNNTCRYCVTSSSYEMSREVDLFREYTFASLWENGV